MAKFIYLQGYGTDGEGYEGLYVDGKLVDENHTLRTESILEVLAKHGVDVEVIYFENDEYWEKSGYRHFKNFEDVKPFLEEE